METNQNHYPKNKTHILLRYTAILIVIAILAIMIFVKLFNTTIIDADKWKNHNNYNQVEKYEVQDK